MIRSHPLVRLGAVLAAVPLVVLGTVLPAAAASAAPAASTCARGSGVDLSKRTLTPAILNKKAGPCADLAGSRLAKIDFEQADLTGYDLRGAVITGGDLSQANLTDTDLTGADLNGTNLEQATFTRAVLTRVRAEHADFEQDDLHGRSLAHADLRDADLGQADLKGADLAHADLAGATLDQADLTGADLTGADLTGASLSEVTGLSATTAGTRGIFPMDALAAVITLLVALAALRRRLRRGASGRPLAAVVVLLFAVLAITEVVAGSSWRPTEDDLFVLPMITPIVFLALFVVGSIRRPSNGWIAAAVGFVQLIAFLLLIDAGLAYLADDVTQTIPLLDSCRSASCAGGAARGVPTIVIAAAVLVVMAIVLRVPALAGPRVGPAVFTQMGSPAFASAQSYGGPATRPPAAASGPSSGPADPPAPSQTI